MDVAIGIITKPIFLKNITLIKIFKITDITDKQKGVLVSSRAKNKFDKIFNIENAGTPKAKKVSAIAVLETLSLLKEP